MTQKNLSYWLKAVILVAAMVGAWVYGFFVPEIAGSYRDAYGEYAKFYLPMLIFITGTGVPCFASLVFAWNIASRIGMDNSFCRENAVSMKVIAILALADVIYFRIGLIIFAFLNISSAPMFFLTLFLDIVGLAISVCSAALSHLILKAAMLREENDLTI